MSLSKLRSPKMKPISDRDLEDEGVVSYTSVNSKTHTSFTAVTDPNSRHAARLAKIALSVQQNDHHKKRHEKKPKYSSWLPQIGFFQQQQQQPRQQIEYTTSSAAAFAEPAPGPSYPNHGPQAYAYAQAQDAHQGTVPLDRPPQSHRSPPQVSVYRSSSVGRSHSRSPSTAYEEVVDAVEVVDVGPPGVPEYHYEYDTASGTYPTSTMTTVTTVVPVHTRHPVGTVIPSERGDRDRDYYQPVEVTRYRTEHKTGYQLRGKAPGDMLRVSAPKWSSEAQLFDAIAEANSAKPATAEYDAGDSDTDPRYHQGKLVKRGRARDPRSRDREGQWDDGW